MRRQFSIGYALAKAVEYHGPNWFQVVTLIYTQRYGYLLFAGGPPDR